MPATKRKKSSIDNRERMDRGSEIMAQHVSGAVGIVAVVLRAGKHEKLRSKMRASIWSRNISSSTDPGRLVIDGWMGAKEDSRCGESICLSRRPIRICHRLRGVTCSIE